MAECAFGDCTNPVPRANALYCSRAHRQAAWKARVGYALVRRDKASLRRSSRDGSGVRPYLSVAEARALLELPIPESVRRKLESKLTAPEPIPGQTDLLTELARLEDSCANAGPTTG